MKIHNPFRTALLATLGVGLGLALVASIQTIGVVLLYVGTALFLSLGLDPIISFAERWVKRRWLAVLVIFILIFGALAGITSIILPEIIKQMSQLVEQINQIAKDSVWLENTKQWLIDLFPNLDVNLVIQEAQNIVLKNTALIGQNLIDITFAIFTGAAGAFIVTILTIYLTASLPSLRSAVYSLVPASSRESFMSIAQQIQNSVGYFVMGQMTLGVINGVLSSIFLSIIHAPFALALAVLAFCGSLIPLVGTLSASTLIVLACMIPGQGSVQLAITAAIYYLIYMQIEAYVITPRVMSRAVAVPGVVVMIAALTGAILGQLLGALVAIPAAASLLIIYRQIIVPKQESL